MSTETETTTRVLETAFSVGALEFLETALEGTAEEAVTTLSGILQLSQDEPDLEFLKRVTVEVMSDAVRRTATETLEAVAEKLRVDYCADL